MARQFLQAADTAAALGITPATVRQAARTGRLRIAGVTRRGTRLFTAEDVECFRKWSRRFGSARAAAHAPKGNPPTD